MSKSNPKNKAKQPWWENLGFQIFAVGISAFILYYNTFTNGFVLDDLSAVQQNEQVQKGIKAIPEILTTPYHYGYDHKDGGLYRPMSVALLAIEKSMFGNQAKPFHIFQTLLYMLSCAIVLLACRRLLKNKLAALFVSLFFVFNPVHTEVVANIKSLDEILGLLGFSISLLYFIKYLDNHKKQNLYFSLLGFLFALFSKESTLALLPVFPLLVWMREGFHIKSIFKQTYLYIIPVAIFIVCFVSFTNSNEAQGIIEPIENAIMACDGTGEVIVFKIQLLYNYIIQSVINVSPNHDYAYKHFEYYSFGDWQAWAYSLVVILYFLFCILNFNKNKFIFLGFAIWLLPLLATSNLLFNIRWTFGERFMYLPLLGMGLVLYELLNHLSQRYIKSKKGILIFMFLYMIVSSFTVINRNKEWKSNLSLFETDVKKSPNNVRLHALLAKEYHDKAVENKDIQLLQKSTDEYYKSIAIKPIAEFVNGLGINYMDLEKYDSALKYFQIAATLKPTLADTWHNIGNAQNGLKQIEAATKSYIRALEINPNYYNSVVNIANMYMEQGQYFKAIEYGRKALQLNPGDKNVMRNLSIYYQKNNQKDSSSYYLQMAK
ncbi:MAG: tetratricopeptide repeat protein [Bacteroidota bacterium]|nr:tetratricopeptide repeat protein [Bacteroidota bacterium]